MYQASLRNVFIRFQCEQVSRISFSSPIKTFLRWKSFPLIEEKETSLILTTEFVPRAKKQNPTHIKWESVQLVPTNK